MALGGVYAVGIPADQIDSRAASLPRPAGELGCYSEPRTSWAQQTLGAVPDEWQFAEVSIPTERRDMTIAIEDVRVHAQQSSTTYQTSLLLCPGVLGAGGNQFTRGLSIGFRDNLPPSVDFFDLDDPDAPKKIDRLALTMTSDDLAVLNVEARAPKPGRAYEWWMTASTVAGGKREEIRIPEQGTYRIGKVSDDFRYWSDLVDPHVCAPDKVVQRGYPASEYWC